jgi:hypothetical protein
MEAPRTDTTSEVTLDEVIAELDLPYTGKLPERAIRAAQQRRDEMAPRLIELIRKASDAVQAGGSPEGYGHLFALYLLTEFDAKESLPAILEAVSLPGDGPFELFGDAITEDLSRVLAALIEAPDVLDDLLRNPSINEYVRWEAAQTYLYLVRDGRLTRDEAVHRIREHLRHAIAAQDAEMANGVVSELLSYSPREALEEIRESFRRDLIDNGLTCPEDVEHSIAEGEARLRQSLNRCPPTGVQDTLAELSDWAAFRGDERRTRSRETPPSSRSLADDWSADEDKPWEQTGALRNTAPKVGRNDPCPCGSGRKYKKCCGMG